MMARQYSGWIGFRQMDGSGFPWEDRGLWRALNLRGLRPKDWMGAAVRMTAAAVCALILTLGSASAVPTEPQGQNSASTPPSASAAAQPSDETEISPEQAALLRKEMLQAVLGDAFRYPPLGLPDPFVPFIKPDKTVTETYPEAEGGPSPIPTAGFPLTPLQKMSLGEVERGLKAILWGEMGARALIEDASGKGYIVKEGTPVTPDGVVERIYKDALVVRQYAWDAKEKQWVPDFVTVQLKKGKEK